MAHARLLVRGLVKRPGKARPERLSNSRLEFHQTTYQKPYPILNSLFYLSGGEPAVVVDSDQQERRGADPRAVPAGRHRHRQQQQRQRRRERPPRQQEQGRRRVEIVTDGAVTLTMKVHVKVLELGGMEGLRI